MSVTIHESQMMPLYGADSSDRLSFAHAQTSSTARETRDAPANGSHQHQSMNGSTQQRKSTDRPSRDDGYFASIHSSKTKDRLCGSTTHVELGQMNANDGAREASRDFHVPHLGQVTNSAYSAAPAPAPAPAPSPSPSPMPQPDDGTSALQIPNQGQRVSSPPAFNHNSPGPSQHPHRLQQRHTLEVPKVQTSRAREPQQNNTDDVVTASGRFSPTTPHRRRGSMSLVRRTTRSIHSDMPPEDVHQDDEAARWAEHIRQKRASKRKRKEDEDEDRVVVGTKVDQNHVNWVTAYNMLTGIRFTVSRTNAKMDRELTDADFDAKHKFSFDMYIPYGRKIHFVVMNNLFPPHRDIHRTFDLKGSTIGRDFKEDNLETNPRATLKDLNWLRRNQHLELGPTKKKMFIEQMQKDVKLLQRLHIMDYSLLIGIHDLEKGNEEKLRDKTLQVFSPGGEEEPEPGPHQLLRTPSKLESARKARELRQMVQTQKPVPMGQTSSKMPDELEDPNRNFYFYSDDGGFRATHEDNAPGEEIYYLGIIDCLTHYSFIKRMEHFIKGIANTESQISAIPPERYGDRFIKFISAVTKTREAAEREKREEATNNLNHLSLDGVDNVIQKAEHQADRSRKQGHTEENVPNLHMRAVRSPSAERGEIGTTLPVVEEAGESSSVGGHSNRSASEAATGANGNSRGVAAPPPQLSGTPYLGPPQLQARARSGDRGREQAHGRAPPTPPKEFGVTGNDGRPPTPPKDEYIPNRNSGPPTPPKEDKSRGGIPRSSLDKDLPRTPLETTIRVN
ncbi:phosphatidylinositol-4-phosphate 5-kinase 1 (PtdIns(4)P-5-kinase 1) [Pyrenophora tritici-repentis Pt-1C-BFP]|uniref:Phosphatidylinositol-4-phosphate 5-kinase 1 (PtdIns(4)P-5-kinase 1) n=1 Tax=Pyrenophora tritici-repentis (strain Pt-1C-BFP) TaxID=426418 RepID=B2VXU4_PYRTR|nr:phosphatidylinositol-4-phosphate 5-kinase 1 (PtdIns(4)P-5-kinase 1) [Pyrenophora tritici-repentis Pt-1C-BFP]EDU45863.1 phosphatidylinositol-4-phosphate 5-kinase 1 (PtdIns(4)P-5-kinase 1) [Pyrenophora tritici-repentis Pt-1C-BFP]